MPATSTTCPMRRRHPMVRRDARLSSVPGRCTTAASMPGELDRGRQPVRVAVRHDDHVDAHDRVVRGRTAGRRAHDRHPRDWCDRRARRARPWSCASSAATRKPRGRRSARARVARSRSSTSSSTAAVIRSTRCRCSRVRSTSRREPGHQRRDPRRRRDACPDRRATASSSTTAAASIRRRRTSGSPALPSIRSTRSHASRARSRRAPTPATRSIAC